MKSKPKGGREDLSFSNLLTRGEEWREQFKDVNLLGQITVPEDDLIRVCRCLGRYLGQSEDERYEAALAVAVVNLAYYSPDDVGASSFREHVFRQFGIIFHPLRWDRDVGPPIARILTEHFQESEEFGPYRYVTPIMRHAGVPAKSIKPFAIFFRDLIKTCGWWFSPKQYQDRLTKALLPESVKQFLSTEQGQRFCRDLARLVDRLNISAGDAESIASLPGFSGELVEQLRGLMKEVPRRSKHLHPPVLVLDTTQLRLAIDFDEKGFDSAYRWDSGAPVRRSRHYLEEQDFDAPPRGLMRAPNGSWIGWGIDQFWDPRRFNFAVIRRVALGGSDRFILVSYARR